jgi:hypothetical protein
MNVLMVSTFFSDSGFLIVILLNIAWIEGTAIFIAVFVVASVGSYNDYKKEEQFLKLQAISEKDNNVRLNVCLLGIGRLHERW